MSAPTETQRVVIVDPGHNSASGHHAELNAQLLATGRAAGLAIECWVDQGFRSSDPAYRPVLRDCGYVDPRHWLDQPGSLHLANRLKTQLQAELDSSAAGPVTCWITHSLLPFQLIGLAKLLLHQPAARVEVGILYGPGERPGGSTDPAAVSPGPERERELAIANARLAWSGLAQAAASAGHQLRIGCSSHLQAALHEPLLRAAGLPAASLQPAVVGAGWQPGSALTASGCALSNDDAPMVLLHWGDLKAEKGRQQVMALLIALLEEHAQAGSSSTADEAPARRWLFHHCIDTALPPNEQQLLARAEQELPGFQLWQGPISTETMQQLLACTAVAFLPYSPQAYAERSSGVLWCYGAARLACGQPARAVGYASGWLAEEAQALGMGWQGVAAISVHPPKTWLAAINAALRAPATPFSTYAQQVLGQSYAQWLLAGLNSASQSHHRPIAPVVAEPLGQPDTTNTLHPEALQELQSARQEAELTLDQLHLVQEELEVYFLKAEELSETLSARDQQISDLQQQLEAARQAATQANAEQASIQALEQLQSQHKSEISTLQSAHSAEITKLQSELQAEIAKQQKGNEAEISKIQKEQKQEITTLNKALADQQRELKAIQPLLEQAKQSQRGAEARAEETQGLLRTAQKMLEGQAIYLQDLSRKEEEADLAIERERLFSSEVLYYLQNSSASPGLDSSRIPRLRTLLQNQRKARAGHSA